MRIPSLVIASPSSATTVVQATVSGRYTLRLTADDGERTASTEVVVDVVLGAAAATNVAGQATATASRVTGWNQVAAINDGNAPWPVTAESDAWGTWGQPADANNAFTATLTWPAPVRVDTTRVLFHSNGDPGGVMPPSSWTLERLEADGVTWSPVPGASGYPTAEGELVTVEHDPVSTTALRMTLVRDGASYPGIVEWEVLADEPVDVEDVAVRTLVGQAPQLPAQVEVVYADGQRVDADVTWQDVPAERYAAEGSFTVNGFVVGTSTLAQATVWVRPTDAVQINTFAPVDVSTVAGTAPDLPARVVATYNDGSAASLPVAWDAVAPEQYAAAGELTVEGTVEGTDKRPVATVTVLAPPAQAPVVMLTTTPEVPPSQWFTGAVDVAVTATDDTDPAPAVEVRVDGGDWAPYTGPVTLSADGSHTVRARATDADGAVSPEKQLVVSIDTAAPEVAASFDPVRRRLSLTTTDGGSGPATTEYAIGDAGWTSYTTPVLVQEEATVRYRATDVAGNTSAEGSVDVPAPTTGGPVNVAPDATPTASATTSWNRVTGLNDGVDTFPVADQATAWGTWGIAGPAQTATLTWAEPVTVDTSRVLFFDDGGGVRLPTSWTLEHLTADGSWAEVPGASERTTTLGEYDVVTHDPVTTTALRVTLVKPANGYVGIVEWEVLDVPAEEGPTLTAPAEPVTAGEGFVLDLVGGASDAEYVVTLEPGGAELGVLATDADGAGRLHTAPVPRDAGGDMTVVATRGDEVLTAPLTVTPVEDPEPDAVVAGTVVVDGTPAVGSPVTVATGGWGPEGVTLDLQWLVDGAEVAGATGPSYTPVPADVGKTLTVRVIGWAEGLRSAEVVSAPSPPVVAGTITTGSVEVLGEPSVGTTLRSRLTGWSPGVALEYQWYAGETAIAGATDPTYRLTRARLGSVVTLQVRASAEGWTTTPWVASDGVGPVAKKIDSKPVRLTWKPSRPFDLTASTASWGRGVTLGYQWLRDGEPIQGETDRSYRLRWGDRGTRISVEVTGSGPGWATTSRTSDSVRIP